MIYFDNAATTKPSLTALNKAKVFNEDFFYNPSALYRYGLYCANAIKEAKNSILKTLGVSENKYEVIFTSCGTESDNTAIFCATKRGTFITDYGEHSAVIKCFNELKNQGRTVCFCGIDKNGKVNEDELLSLVNKVNAGFVSVMHVNNETGAINDVNRLSAEIKKINPNIIFHSDGVQAYGKIPFSLSENIDMYSVSAHKINGLKGVGALIKRKKLNVSPLIFGGGQENGLRSGTENVFGIKVFQYAAEEHYSRLNENYEKVNAIKNYIKENLDKKLFRIISGTDSSPYILSVSAVGLRGEVLMHILEEKGFITGNGSACSSKNRFSRVIESCGYKNDVLDGVLRLSFSAENTIEEAKDFVFSANEAALTLKGIM